MDFSMENEISHFYLIPKLSRKSSIKSLQSGVPTACRESYLNEDDKRIYNENKNWVQALHDNGPIWSPMKNFNCVGQQRQLTVTKDNNYDIEIPQRLLSLWGSAELYHSVAVDMQTHPGHRLVNNVLALCMCLKYDLNTWSSQMLDDIAKTGSQSYKDLLRKFNIYNHQLLVKHLASTYRLEDSEFRVELHQAAAGLLYMPYGLNEFNLARGLGWFFKYYQFGLLQCHDRCLAFGYAVDIDHGYFMYDCQSTGLPLFGENQANSYVLRTNHLQILLYCLIVTLRVTADNEKFAIYNVDIQMRAVEKTKAEVTKKSILNFTSRFGFYRNNGVKMANNRLQAGNEDERKNLKTWTVNKSGYKTNAQSSKVITEKKGGMHSSQCQLPNDHGFWKVKQSVPVVNRSPSKIAKRLSATSKILMLKDIENDSKLSLRKSKKIKRPEKFTKSKSHMRM